MQLQAKNKHNRKTMTVSLYELNDLKNSKQNNQPKLKNINFQYLVFVGRLCKKNQKYIFTDQTQFLVYEGTKIIQNLKQNSYYQCMCQLKPMGSGFVPKILSCVQVDGNAITTHMVRLIKQDIQIKMLSKNSGSPSNINLNENKDNLSQQFQQQMRQWIKQKKQFNLEQLQKQFSNKTSHKNFATVLNKLEDSQYIGNMGDYYIFID